MQRAGSKVFPAACLTAVLNAAEHRREQTRNNGAEAFAKRDCNL